MKLNSPTPRNKLNNFPIFLSRCVTEASAYAKCISTRDDVSMYPTLREETALGLAYAAGRSQVLVDVLPKQQMVELLMRIDDIVPANIRRSNEQKQHKRRLSERGSLLLPETAPNRLYASPTTQPSWVEKKETRKVSADAKVREEKGFSFIRRLADNIEAGAYGRTSGVVTGKGQKSELINVMVIWRKILLNDNVELMETLRDSMVWRQSQPKVQDGGVTSIPILERKKVVLQDFEAAQNLTLKQMSELFCDCYENGTGMYTHIKTHYLEVLKSGNFLMVFRSLTGLLKFRPLSTEDVVIWRPLYCSLLFLAVICGRFRVAENLLRIRQFDILPVATLIVLILRRFQKESGIPQQTLNELEHYAERFEAIAVDVLNQVLLKDNTPEKMICRQILIVPLRTFGGIPLLDLFAKAKCIELLSLPGCQRLLDERWYGVLSFLPHFMLWPIRLFPFSGIFYLEYKAYHERKEAIFQRNNQLTAAAKTVIGATNTIMSSSKYSSTMSTNQSSKTALQSKRTTVHPTSPNEGLINTVFYRMARQMGWDGSPRLHFIGEIYQSPSMKFFFHSILHLMFLLTFSSVCLYRLNVEFNFLEVISLFYIAGYAIEEFRQMVLEGFRESLLDYFKDQWNWIDLLAVTFCCAGFVVRQRVKGTFSSPYQEALDSTLYAARNLYLIGLNFFYMRTLYITSISQIIGPRLKMMADMLRKDLIPLLIVFAIFILSFGVWFQGAIYPNSMYTTHKNKIGERMNFTTSLKEFFRRTFYSIFEVSIVLEEESCDEENSHCGSELGFNIVLHLAMVLYIGIVNLILINLLIALFSNTVSRIDQQANALWLAGRYKMVKEYNERSLLPPPLNGLCVLYEIGKLLSLSCIYCCKRKERRHQQVRKRCDSSSSSSAHSESENDLSRQLISHKYQHIKSRIRRGRYIKMILGRSNSYLNSEKFEVDSVMKFILLQGFALQDRRHLLGTGTSSAVIANPPSASGAHQLNIAYPRESISQQELKSNESIKQMQERLDTFEVILEGISAKLDKLNVSLNQAKPKIS